MEQELDSLLLYVMDNHIIFLLSLLLVNSEKERQVAETEIDASAANKALQQSETTLSNMKAQVQAKRDELQSEW